MGILPMRSDYIFLDPYQDQDNANQNNGQADLGTLFRAVGAGAVREMETRHSELGTMPGARVCDCGIWPDFYGHDSKQGHGHFRLGDFVAKRCH